MRELKPPSDPDIHRDWHSGSWHRRLARNNRNPRPSRRQLLRSCCCGTFLGGSLIAGVLLLVYLLVLDDNESAGASSDALPVSNEEEEDPTLAPSTSSTLAPLFGAEIKLSSCDDKHEESKIDWSENAPLPIVVDFEENSAVTSTHFHPNGNFLVAASGNKFNISILSISDDDSNTPVVVQSLEEPTANDAHVKVVRFSSMHGNMIASGSESGNIHLWKWDSNSTGSKAQHVNTLRHHTETVKDIAFHPHDPTLLLCASLDGSISVWKIDEDGNLKWRKTLGCSTPSGTSTIHALSFSAAGDRLASSDTDGYVTIWNMEKDAVLAVEKETDDANCLDVDSTVIDVGFPLYAVAYNCDSTLLAFAGAATEGVSPIHIDRASIPTSDEATSLQTADHDGYKSLRLDYHTERVRTLAWYGPYLVSGSWRGHFVLWDTATSRSTANPFQATLLSGSADSVTQVLSAAWSADGNYIACGTLDGRGKVRIGRLRIYRVPWVESHE